MTASKPRGLGPDEIGRAAPAKLNLYLHVVGKRPDGYHLLDSLIAFAGVYDVVAVRAAADLTLTIEGPRSSELAADDSNLVLRAGRALRAAAEIAAGASIRLIKRLPLASGIGGGSADAAATLLALRDLWHIDLPAPRVAEVALALGADVPVCLHGKAAFVGGIGEQIAPAPELPRAWLVLANPGLFISTPEVFRARTGPFSAPGRFAEPPADLPALVRLLAERRNDLTPPALAICPEVSRVVEALSRLRGCLFARMSGSGATCFGIFERESEALLAEDELRNAQPRWWIATAPLLTDTAALEPNL